MGNEKTAVKGGVSLSETDRLKELGFIKNSGTDKFNCRVVTRSGRMNVPELKEITYMAEVFGDQEVILTPDGAVEIKGISYGNVDKVLEHCKKHSISTGGTGARVRPILTCTGKECAYSILDAYALAEKLRELFYVRLHEVRLPGKMEIAVSGCPSNCVDADLFDIGIVGVKIPQCELVNCMGCKSCAVEKKCPQGAARVEQEKLKIQPEKCSKCGLCVGVCPFGAVTKSLTGYRIVAGGNKGLSKREGFQFRPLFTTEESVLTVVDRLIGIYQEEGQQNEAFYETMERIGFANVEKKVLLKNYYREERLS